MQAQLLKIAGDIKNLPHGKAISTEPSELKVLLQKHKINDSEYNELLRIVGRTPSLAEIGVFSAMWSEHCSYKSSKVHLKKLPTEGPNVVVGPGENAGVVRLSGKLCAAFKMESHNHPSYIEPYQGAATGVGGILRDVFCMGARPIANLNCLRFGERQHPRTHYLFSNVVKGVGDYGNCVGIPTIAGSVSFDKTYNGNILVNAMTVGLIHEDRIFKGYARGNHNLVVYVGSATGRDGIHGASMASDSFTTQHSSERSTVQVGDPFAEKLLLEATLESLEKGLVLGLQDMGAAGLTSSSFEMADRAGSGLLLNLDLVPTRAKNMSAYELLLSESQERMLMCVEPDKWGELKTVLSRWEIPFAIIGLVTDTGRMQIVKDGAIEVDLDVGPLADRAPRYNRPYHLPTRNFSENKSFRSQFYDLSLSKILAAMIGDDGDKAKIYSQYDHHIGNRTVRGPEDGGAGILWLRSDWAEGDDKYLGVAVTAGCNERYCEQDPLLGAAQAVTSCYRSICATGAEPLAVTDCLNYGNPEDPDVMGQFVAGIDGIALACRNLGTPVVSGNVSLYNQTDNVSIAPTPMIGMIGKHRDVRKAAPAIINQAGHLYLIRPKIQQAVFGGSLAFKLFGTGINTEQVPPINWEFEKEAAGIIRKIVNLDLVAAARNVGVGGPLLTILKMIIGRSNLGAKLHFSDLKVGSHKFEKYFGEISATYLIQTLLPLNLKDFAKDQEHIEIIPIGIVLEAEIFEVDGIVLPLEELKNSSLHSLEV